MRDVGEHGQDPRLVGVERVARERRRDEEPERARLRDVEKPWHARRERGGRAADERDDERDLQHEVEASAGRRAVPIPLAADEREEQREEEELREWPPDARAEQRRDAKREDGRAAAGENAEVVQRPQQDVAPGERHRRAEDRAWGGAPCTDREREHALLVMAVVRDDAPAHAVRAPAQIRLERDGQRASACTRLAREHGGLRWRSRPPRCRRPHGPCRRTPRSPVSARGRARCRSPEQC